MTTQPTPATANPGRLHAVPAKPNEPNQPSQSSQPTKPTKPTLCDREHLASLHDALTRFQDCVDVVDAWGSRLAPLLRDGGRLLAAGNGGSAAQAQHLTAELVGRYRQDRPPMSAICLTAETSSLTAIANDYHSDELFARQVEAHARRDDVLVVLSTSGGSSNLLAAARRARSVGARVWALTGPLPNPLAEAADEFCAVDTAYPATVQELHLVAVHVLCAAFDRTLGICDGTARIADLSPSVVDREPEAAR